MVKSEEREKDIILMLIAIEFSILDIAIDDSLSVLLTFGALLIIAVALLKEVGRRLR